MIISADDLELTLSWSVRKSQVIFASMEPTAYQNINWTHFRLQKGLCTRLLSDAACLLSHESKNAFIHNIREMLARTRTEWSYQVDLISCLLLIMTWLHNTVHHSWMLHMTKKCRSLLLTYLTNVQNWIAISVYLFIFRSACWYPLRNSLSILKYPVWSTSNTIVHSDFPIVSQSIIPTATTMTSTRTRF